MMRLYNFSSRIITNQSVFNLLADLKNATRTHYFRTNYLLIQRIMPQISLIIQKIEKSTKIILKENNIFVVPKNHGRK